MLAFAILIISAFLSAIGVGWIRRLAITHSMIDIPNERSSHDVPTPHGGGLSIAGVVLIGTACLAMLDQLAWQVAGAIWIGGLVAYIGYMDDRGDLAPSKRIIIHFISAVLGIVLLGGMPPLDLGFTVFQWEWLGHLIGVIGIVWMINLYNFMDGIDGLAASEAVFVFGAGGLLLGNAGLMSLALLCALVAGASLGFLWWNWPPAKIFMGDVGSGFLGYLIAILAIAGGNEGFSLWIWLILVGVFFVDATVTLLRRMLRGEKWYAPHRSHAYQHLTQRWGSHLRVTLAATAINFFWLLPLAAAIYSANLSSILFSSMAMLPLVGLAFIMGAGVHKEISPDSTELPLVH